MFKSLMSTFVKEIKKTHPQINCKVNNGGSFYITNQERYADSVIRIRLEYGIVMVQIQHRLNFEIPYTFLLDALAEQMKPAAILVETRKISSCAITITPPYEVMDEKTMKRWNGVYKQNRIYSDSFLRIIDEEKVNELIKISKKVKEVLLLMKKEDDLFTYRLPRYDFRLEDISFYHQGKEGTLGVMIEEGVVSIEDYENKWSATIDSVDEIEKTLRTYFEKISRKKRIENIFSTPKHHFTNYMDKCIRYTKLHDPIYSALLEHYSADELEKKFAKTKQTRIVSTKSHPEYGIVTLLDYIFVLEYDGKLYKYPLAEKAAAEEKFRELNLRWILCDVDDHLTKFNGRGK